MLQQLRDLIQKKIQSANAATFVHTRLAAAVKAIEANLHNEAVSALAEARSAEMTIMGGFRDEFEAFAGTAIGEMLKRLAPEHELTADVDVPRQPPLAGAKTAEPAPTTAELAKLDAEPAFPTLAEFVAQGFYADTYEFQKAAWLKEHQTATPTPERPAENAPSDLATGASSGSA